jgi:hypothetical protein
MEYFHLMMMITIIIGNRDNSVGVATGYKARVRFPAVQDFSPLCTVQTDSDAHPVSYATGIGDPFLKGKSGRSL